MRRNADRAAQGYLEAATLEQEVGRRMLERLEYVKLAPKRILDAGSGPSPQSSALTQRYRDATLVPLDHSLQMLRQVEPPGLLRRLAGRARTVALCADFGRLPLAARSFSLVWSNMALHWGASPQAALAEFHRVLEVEGLLMFSTVGPDTLKELRSAFSNLVSNAVRYTPEGGAVTLFWMLDGARGVFGVEDTGIGVESRHIPRLTERFYRVDQGRSRDTGGTGLGLAIVKHVLTRHQASLEVESELGKGSVFRAVFPAQRVTPLDSAKAAA